MLEEIAKGTLLLVSAYCLSAMGLIFLGILSIACLIKKGANHV